MWLRKCWEIVVWTFVECCSANLKLCPTFCTTRYMSCILTVWSIILWCITWRDVGLITVSGTEKRIRISDNTILSNRGRYMLEFNINSHRYVYYHNVQYLAKTQEVIYFSNLQWGEKIYIWSVTVASPGSARVSKNKLIYWETEKSYFIYSFIYL